MGEASRAIRGHKQTAKRPGMVAASRAPVAEPERSEAPAVPVPRPITPAEAERAAQAAVEARAERARKVSGGSPSPDNIPSLPPAPRQPVRFTPLGLVLLQMLLDTFGI